MSTAAPPILWCDGCETERVPLEEDGTCGWCGRSAWRDPTTRRAVGPDGGRLVRPTSAPGHHDQDAVRAIMEAVAARFGFSTEELLARSREPRRAAARQVAMATARAGGASYPAIAAVFERNHSTVIHAVRAVADRGEPLPTIEVVRPPLRRARTVKLSLRWGSWRPLFGSDSAAHVRPRYGNPPEAPR